MATDNGVYCHIRGDKGLLCNTTGDNIQSWGTSSPEIESYQARGLKICPRCERSRCQECIWVWEGMQQSKLIDKIIPR